MAAPLLWLSPTEVPPLPDGWQALPTEQVVDTINSGPRYENKTVQKKGAVPVVSQSETEFMGYHNDAPGVVASPHAPVVTFTNHTCALRLMKQPFSCIQNVFPKVGKPGICDTTYFYYAVQNRVVLTDYKGHHPLFRQAHIPVPPLPIQRRIASILSAYDDLIENNRKRIAILEDMARRLYREWFVHFRYPGLQESDYQKVGFADVLASMAGGGWGEEAPTTEETISVMVVRGTDIDDLLYGNDIRAPTRFIKPSSLISRRLKRGDIIIENSINAKSRCVGKTLPIDQFSWGRIGDPAIAASFCKVLRPKDPALAPLIHLHVRNLRETGKMEFYQNVATNGIANFQATRFAESESLVLPKDSTHRSQMLASIGVLSLLSSNLASQISVLRRTRDLLLPRLMSGTLSVDALATAEAAVP